VGSSAGPLSQVIPASVLNSITSGNSLCTATPRRGRSAAILGCSIYPGFTEVRWAAAQGRFRRLYLQVCSTASLPAIVSAPPPRGGADQLPSWAAVSIPWVIVSAPPPRGGADRLPSGAAVSIPGQFESVASTPLAQGEVHIAEGDGCHRMGLSVHPGRFRPVVSAPSPRRGAVRLPSWAAVSTSGEISHPSMPICRGSASAPLKCLLG